MIATLDYTTTDLIASPYPTVLNESGNAEFDIAAYLVPGHQYGHMELKQLYYDIGDMGLNCQQGDVYWRWGLSFHKAVYKLWETGWIEMTKAKDYDGYTVDFFAAVVYLSHHHENPKFKLVEGYLLLLGLPDGEA